MKYAFPLILISSLSLSACTRDISVTPPIQQAPVIVTDGPQSSDQKTNTETNAPVNVGEVSTTSMVEISTGAITPSKIRR